MIKDVSDTDIVLAPPFTALHAVAEAARNTPIGVAGQDLYWEPEGAYTGEVSAAMLKDAGAEYVIIGHSERRRLFGETDTAVNSKTVAALRAELTPIVCLGETLQEREGGQTLGVLDRQIRQGLAGLTADQVARARDCLRARVGHRHRAKRDPRAGRPGTCAHPRAARGAVRPGCGRGMPRHLWWQRQA